VIDIGRFGTNVVAGFGGWARWRVSSSESRLSGSFHHVAIAAFGVVGPLVVAKKLVGESTWKELFQVFVQDEIVFAVEIDPAAIAVVVVIVEGCDGFIHRKDLV
jgi:hypothetical protein